MEFLTVNCMKYLTVDCMKFLTIDCMKFLTIDGIKFLTIVLPRAIPWKFLGRYSPFNRVESQNGHRIRIPCEISSKFGHPVKHFEEKNFLLKKTTKVKYPLEVFWVKIFKFDLSAVSH